MARTVIPVSSRASRVVVNPMAAPVSDPVNDHTMVNNGATLIMVRNTGVVTRNAQAIIEQMIDGELPTPVDFAIPAGVVVPLGPWPRSIYGDNLLFNVDSTDLQLQAFSLT